MVDITSTDWFENIDVSVGGIFPFYQQQSSRSIGGISQVRDMADQLWVAEFTTVPMLLEDAMEIETDLLSLNGSLDRLVLFDPRKKLPKLYDHSDPNDLLGFSYTSIETNRHIINVVTGGVDFSKGDMFSFESNGSIYLHKVTSVISPTQIRIWPAMMLSAPDSSSIIVDRPHAKFFMDPEIANDRLMSIDNNTKQATVSFKGVQTLK